jgi:hypothetical protein
VFGPIAIWQKSAKKLIWPFKGKGKTKQDVPRSSIKESRYHAKHYDNCEKNSKLRENEAI